MKTSICLLVHIDAIYMKLTKKKDVLSKTSFNESNFIMLLYDLDIN